MRARAVSPSLGHSQREKQDPSGGGEAREFSVFTVDSSHIRGHIDTSMSTPYLYEGAWLAWVRHDRRCKPRGIIATLSSAKSNIRSHFLGSGS